MAALEKLTGTRTVATGVASKAALAAGDRSLPLAPQLECARHGRQTADQRNTLSWEALRWQNRSAGLLQKKDVWFERIFEMQIWLGPELARSRFVWKLTPTPRVRGGGGMYGPS